MLRIKFMLNLVVILILLGITYLVTMYGEPVRSTIQNTKTAVAGASTSHTDLQNTLPQKLQQDMQSHVEEVKTNVLSVSLGEIFSFFTRAGKIIDDIHILQSDIKDQVSGEEEAHE